MRIFRYLLFISISIFAISNSNGENYNIIPQPSNIFPGKGEFVIDQNTTIGAVPELQDYASYLADIFSVPMNIDLKIVDKKDGANIKLVLDPDLKEEGYSLVVSPEEIIITGGDKGGVFYGIQTLLQLLPSEIYKDKAQKNIVWQVPAIEITDSPEHPWRGMMLDVARYYHSTDYIKHLIDMMAMYKMNKLQLHLTDDSGWRLESEKYPKLTELGAYAGTQGDRLGGYYTKDEMKDLIDYADFRNVEIIPEIEFPAHILSAIVAYPELSCTGLQHELPRQHFISEDILCVGKENSLNFLFNILEETANLFPSSYINIGGDEAVYKRWEACDSCQALKTKLGLEETKELQGWLTDTVASFMKNLDRTAIGWEEIITRGEVATPVVALIWHEVSDTTFVANTPHKAILTPATHTYLDFPESSTEGEVKAATWMPPIPLQKVYEMPINDYSETSQVMGVQGCLWSDQFIIGEKLQNIDLIDENRSSAYMDYLTFPRMLALSEVGWDKYGNRNWEDFSDRLTTHYKKLENMGAGYRVPEPILVSIDTDADNNKIIKLKPSVEGSQIKYTLDGTYPTKHSTTYSTEGITVSVGKKIMASTVVNNRRVSLPLIIEF